MLKNLNSQKIVSYIILILIVLVNLYLFRAEVGVPSFANDDVFHAALVDEARDIWKGVFSGRLSPFYLFDSYNERWNEGFALSTYYSHLPQAAIALLSFIPGIDAFRLFVIVKYLALALLPVSFFLSARILKLPHLYGAILALFSHLILTDGLYGIDITSFLWRGWGISAQLFALAVLPIAFAYSYRYLAHGTHLVRALAANFAVAQFHVGIFYLLALSYPVLVVVRMIGWIGESGGIGEIWKSGKMREIARRFVVLGMWLFFLLSYYLVPFILYGEYRSFSYWDSLWKFNSFGAKPIITWFLDGKLFDFGRQSVLTLFVVLGVFSGLLSTRRVMQTLATLFVLYFVLFFGRAGLGGLIDMLPGLSEFHLHRFIVLVQFVGLYLAAWFVYDIMQKLFKLSIKFRHKDIPIREVFFGSAALAALFAIFIMEKPVVKYARENHDLIQQANKRYSSDVSDYKKIIRRLRKLPPGRVYAGRPGNWGRELKVGDTQLYMQLSQDGFAVVGFAPESWSPNTDYDQFFNDQNRAVYDLYNVRYALFPKAVDPPDFAKKIAEHGKYRLYSIDTGGWFTLGRSISSFSGSKTHFYNLVRLWFNQRLFETGEFPTVDLHDDVSIQKNHHFKLIDLNNYVVKTSDVSDRTRNIWQENPLLGVPPVNKGLLSWRKQQEEAFSQGYRVRLTLPTDCPDCMLVFKQTFHPNWRVKVNDKFIKPVPVFPFYIGIPVSSGGEYIVEAVYRPNTLKVVLLIGEVVVVVGFGLLKLRRLL